MLLWNNTDSRYDPTLNDFQVKMDEDIEESVMIRFVLPEGKDEFSVSGN